jgi:hypothetical protein
MSLSIQTLNKIVPRPWGYEVRVDYIGDGGRIYNEVLIFKTEPSQSEITTAVEDRRVVLELQLTPPDPEYVIVNGDGTETTL